MSVTDPDIKKITLDGQELFCPTSKQWVQILNEGKFYNHNVFQTDLLRYKIERNAQYPELKSCLSVYNGRMLFIELLKIESDLIRVFVESVICETCKNKALISATPGVSDLYIGLSNPKQAREKGYKHKNQRCKYCNNVYERRYTVWQKYE
ncbi:hypothetical protein FUAX_32510 [Fulvitalea axinellae]|uniref:Mut7-C RNAse domain-containing protein n=1 Tax=Fulvitalea axinellae TaxID=1182444 RepID=A0AAU9D8D3_9BACT|nr:hypothetical protein FUAX_32510 [Fulvitalea axinellae]